MYKIEKNVPLPTTGNHKGRKRKYPLDKLQIGDSFLLKEKRERNCIPGAAHSYRTIHNLPDFKVITRKTEQGIRVWRVK